MDVWIENSFTPKEILKFPDERLYEELASSHAFVIHVFPIRHNTSPKEIAALEQQALDDKAKEVDDQREAMLITVQGMNKTALTEYAKKYDHAFDSKAKVDDMRITVNGLIHQFGVR